MRLTVVSSCGMVGTIVTGFLGMNLYSHADLPTWEKLFIFAIVFVPTVVLALYTVIISRRLANFMEACRAKDLPGGKNSPPSGRSGTPTAANAQSGGGRMRTGERAGVERVS